MQCGSTTLKPAAGVISVKVLHLRMILNALAMLISAGGAAMLVPAVYSLLKAPEEAWVFWAPGVIVLALGAVLSYSTIRQPCIYVSRQSMFLIVVLSWLGVVLV